MKVTFEGSLSSMFNTDSSQGGLNATNLPNKFQNPEADGGGLRAYTKVDGSLGGQMMPKDTGWLGEIAGKGKLKGSKLTEFSSEDEKGMFPLINPYLSKEEVQKVSEGIVTSDMQKKAVKWRDDQVSKGLDPFYNSSEQQQ
jgi:hypothetical protein